MEHRTSDIGDKDKPMREEPDKHGLAGDTVHTEKLAEVRERMHKKYAHTFRRLAK